MSAKEDLEFYKRVGRYCLSLKSNSGAKHSMVHEHAERKEDDIDMLLNNFNDLSKVVDEARNHTQLRGWHNIGAICYLVCF